MIPEISRTVRCTVALVFLFASMNAQAERSLTRKELLGKLLFEDTRLSTPEGQACSGCHSGSRFFIDPVPEISTSEGAVKGRFVPRNTPTILYGSVSPKLHWDEAASTWVGGQFWDGREDTQATQALKPFLGHLEMNNDDLSVIVEKIQKGPYAKEFIRVYGKRIFENPSKAYDKVGDAIQAFERTARFSPFNSRYDRYLEGQDMLTPQESRGRQVFEREDKGNCAACHPHKPSPDGKQRPLFTDFSYDNIGVPRNIENRFYALPPSLNPQGWSFIDRGLGATVNDEGQDGKFKVPTLRNIARTGPYMHNGYFKTLRGVLEFYNTRDILPACANAWATEQEARKMNCWPQAEISRNVNHDELGHLGLSKGDIDDLLAFLHSLNDD
ncbi:MAG: hypothetical protein RLZ25_244 [Pseudomonadota bacterium]